MLDELTNAISAANAACVAVFGRPVSYQPISGPALAVMGILERVSDEEMQADGIYAKLFVNGADLAGRPESGDQVTIAGTVYTVWSVETETDGGGARLSLRAMA